MSTPSTRRPRSTWRWLGAALLLAFAAPSTARADIAVPTAPGRSAERGGVAVDLPAPTSPTPAPRWPAVAGGAALLLLGAGLVSRGRR